MPQYSNKDFSDVSLSTDFDLIAKSVRECSPKGVGSTNLKPAGVMVLLFERRGEYTIILNRRTKILDHHKGEISFPGGGMEPDDEGLLDTALRETFEEMGIKREEINVLGRIDDAQTKTGYMIRPFVGIIDYPYSYTLSKYEVEEVLEMPLVGLFSSEYQRDEIHLSEDEEVKSPVYVFDGNVVFGATARILENLADLIAAA